MLRLFIMLPFVIVLIVFAAYNQEVVTLAGPYGYAKPFSLAVLVIIVAVLFFLIGAVAVWFAELRQRRRARRAEQSVRALEAQNAELRLQLAQSVTQTHLAQQGLSTSGAPQPHALPPAAL